MSKLRLIKKINTESIFYMLYDAYKNISEDKIESLCISIEEDEIFKKLFFFYDEDTHDYYYDSLKEKNIKNYLIEKLNEYSMNINCINFEDYRKYLLDNCDSYNEILLHFRLGKIYIKEGALYTSLYDEFLNEDVYINRLMEAENFYDELTKIKKECLTYLFETAIMESKWELEKIELKNL
jgi:hypothetical protein